MNTGSLLAGLGLIALLSGCAGQVKQTVNALGGVPSSGVDGYAAAVNADFQARGPRGTAPMLNIRSANFPGLFGFVEAGARDGVTTWRAANNTTLATRDGMVIASRGFGDDLMSADIDEVRPLVLGRQTGQGVRIHRYLDGNENIRIESFVCDVAPTGSQDVVTRSGTQLGTVVQEDCISPDRHFVNQYWVVQGRAVRSFQWFSPVLGRTTLQEVSR